jgi:hypothetical protein
MTLIQKTKKKTETIVQLPQNPLAYEVLELASKQRSRAKKVEVLKKYSHDSLKAIFIWNFDESIRSALPDGPVPYNTFEDTATQSGTLSDKINFAVDSLDRANSSSMNEASGRIRSSLRKEWTKLYNFVKGGNDKLSGLRRETMFINILETLHPREAEILILVKDKRLTEKYNINQEIVQEAYPDIKWGNRT